MNRVFKKILLLTVITSLLFANAPVHAWSWTEPLVWVKAKITNILWPKNEPIHFEGKPEKPLTIISNIFTPKPTADGLLDSDYERQLWETKNLLSDQEQPSYPGPRQGFEIDQEQFRKHKPTRGAGVSDSVNTGKSQEYRDKGKEKIEENVIEEMPNDQNHNGDQKDSSQDNPQNNTGSRANRRTNKKVSHGRSPNGDTQKPDQSNISPTELSLLKAKRAIYLNNTTTLGEVIRKNHQLLKDKKTILLGYATESRASDEVHKLLSDLNKEKVETEQKIPVADVSDSVNTEESKESRDKGKEKIEENGTEETPPSIDSNNSFMPGQLEKVLEEPEIGSSKDNQQNHEQPKDSSQHNQQAQIFSIDEFRNLGNQQEKRNPQKEKIKKTHRKKQDEFLIRKLKLHYEEQKKQKTQRDEEQKAEYDQKIQQISKLREDIKEKISTAIRDNNLKTIFNMIKTTERDELTDKMSQYALKIALENKNVEAIELLLLADIRPNSKDSLDCTFTCIKNGEKWNTIMKLLDPYGTEITQSQNSSNSFWSLFTRSSTHTTHNAIASPFIQYALDHNMKQAVTWAIDKNKYLDMDAQYTYNGKLINIEEISKQLNYKELCDILEKGMITSLSDSWFGEEQTNTVLTDSIIDQEFEEFEREENMRPTIHAIDALNRVIGSYASVLLNKHTSSANAVSAEIKQNNKIVGLNDLYGQDQSNSMTLLNYIINDGYIENLLQPENKLIFQHMKNNNRTKEFKHIIAKTLLDWGADPKISDEVAGLPLTCAALTSQDTLCCTLIKYGAKINSQDTTHNNKTALEALLYKKQISNQGNTDSDLEIARTLINNGAKQITINSDHKEQKLLHPSVCAVIERVNNNEKLFTRGDKDKTTKWKSEQELTQ